ncbi:MAG: VOC family protein [Candidatus Eisenbacteria bacterium]|uniref:VOC family protein n=1 Tax=Eiseniibacteriota bacterium TaxID=2212470 RepID=A0A956NAX2_UNCEI|nr:VOC family protein [Candidatus Eisenbacteria bacterium]MCB9465556.1 VOC family protein [Candidatus Eisenbacteria bacterium]
MTGSSASPLSFIYHELWTSDPDGRVDFYRALFGWEIVRETRTDGEFLRIRHAGAELARIVPMEDGETPDRWNVFLAVPDLEAMRARVEAASGDVLIREQNLPGLGLASLLMDPEGGVFAATQSSVPDTAAAAGEPAEGTFVWHDLLTPNLEESSRFYQRCWGVVSRSHSPDTADVHRLLRSEGIDMAGLLATRTEDHAALWLPYIRVADVVETVEQATEAGGQVWLEPTEVEELGTFAVLSDPGRALFAVRNR